MGVIGTMALLAVPAFLLGIMAGLIYNYMALRKWRREQRGKVVPPKVGPKGGAGNSGAGGWYHTWSRH
jgi:hypothetical protein